MHNTKKKKKSIDFLVKNVNLAMGQLTFPMHFISTSLKVLKKYFPCWRIAIISIICQEEEIWLKKFRSGYYFGDEVSVTQLGSCQLHSTE